MKFFLNIQNGNPELTKAYIEENIGKYPVYSSKTENNGEIGRINKFEYNGEYITMTKDGSCGDFFYRNGKFSVSNAFVFSIKENKKEKFDLYFIFLLLKKYEKNIKLLKYGSTVLHIQVKDLNNFELYLPEIEEQKKISKIIKLFRNEKEKIVKLKDLILKILLSKYKINQNKNVYLKEIVNLELKKYVNQKEYLATNAFSEFGINFNKKIIISDLYKKPTRADLSPVENSFIFSKIIGENKFFFFKKKPEYIVSTGFFNITTKFIDHFSGFLLSNHFKKQKKNFSTGTTIIAITKKNFLLMQIKKELKEEDHFTKKINKFLALMLKIEIINNKITKILINKKFI